jgi:sigma-54 dependent transcriptional regulator, acetoin dehydrogenase operon transcriptional activator AcoR
MEDDHKSKQQLINELRELRERVASLEAAEASWGRADQALQEIQKCNSELTEANKLLRCEIAERKITDGEAGDHLHFLQTLLDAIPNAVFYKDVRGKYLGCNSAFCKSIGLSQSEIVGKTVYDIGPKELADIYRKKDRELFENPGVQVYQSSLRYADGKRRKVVFHKATFWNRDGSLGGLIGVILDITDLKKTEQLLRKSEERYRAVFNNAAVGIDLADSQGRLTRVNEARATMLGYTQEELHNVPFLKITHPKDVEASGEKFHALIEGKISSYRMQKRYIRKNGDILWADVSVSAIHNRRGKFECTIGVMSDITELKLAEDALRQSEERFRAIFETSEQCMFIKDGSLRYTHVNPALSKLFGFPRSKIIGLRADDFLDAEAAKRIRERDTRVLAGESIEAEQTRTVRGIPMTFLESILPLKDRAGSVVGLCGISRDITERKKFATESHISADEYPSTAMRITLEKAHVAAERDSIVLLQGESGSGKDYLAHWIHDHSPRAGGPFFSINCAALPRELAESELFGHERGAFTGALGLKKGMLELAEGGTILLNEIGELDLSIQSKLLAFLDTRSFLRVGGHKHISVNARLIAATHRDLRAEVAERRFLEPLFYRLSVFPIDVPPLRERLADIAILLDQIMSKLRREMQLPATPRLDSGHMNELIRYKWPGNVRELRNVLERSLMLWNGGSFELTLPQAEKAGRGWSYTVRYAPGTTLRDLMDELGTALCAAMLKLCNGNKKETARLLDISRDTLYRYIRMLKKDSKISTRL